MIASDSHSGCTEAAIAAETGCASSVCRSNNGRSSTERDNCIEIGRMPVSAIKAQAGKLDAANMALGGLPPIVQKSPHSTTLSSLSPSSSPSATITNLAVASPSHITYTSKLATNKQNHPLASQRPAQSLHINTNPALFASPNSALPLPTTSSAISNSASQTPTAYGEVNGAILMLARAQAANDILYNDPKRVVIEHGHVKADVEILRSLTDVTSPTTLVESSPNTAFLYSPADGGPHTLSCSDMDTARVLSSDTLASLGEGKESEHRKGQDGTEPLAAKSSTESTTRSLSTEHTAVADKGRTSSTDGAPYEDDEDGAIEAYKEYPQGDERALPDFILSCKTMGELDAVTSSWEGELDSIPDGGFWRSVIEDVGGLKKRAPLHLTAKIRGGIPARVRGMVWQTLTQARSTYLQTVYTQLIKEYSPHERVIRRDLPRTFPRIPVFRSEGGEGQQRLFRILKAYSLYDAEVGYCQGLGFIIGPLMLNMGECEAFCVLVRLMETYELRTMFTEDMAGLHLRLYQFSALAAEIIPDVMCHMDTHGVLPAMYVPSWFLSLFAYTLPLNFVLRAMDVILTEGAPESIMRIGIALLRRNSAQILAQDDFESIMRVLNTGLYDDEAKSRDRPGYVLQEASQMSAVVTSQRLSDLEAHYCKEHGIAAQRGARQSVSSNSIVGVVRQSISTESHSDIPQPPVARGGASNRTIMNFLGWPWGNNNSSSRNSDSRTLSTATTPVPQPLVSNGNSGAASGAAAATAGSGLSKWRIRGNFSNLVGRSNSSGGGHNNKGSDRDTASLPPLDGGSYSSGNGTPDETNSGRISPRALELTEEQKNYSHKLRERILQELQTQENSPATLVSSVTNMTFSNNSNNNNNSNNDDASIMQCKSSESINDAIVNRRTLPLSKNDSDSGFGQQRVPSGGPGTSGRNSLSYTWQEDVLEPLQRQLYDARVTCDSHRDALTALQAEHESLRSSMVMVKLERAELAEQNEQLRMLVRKMEGERERALDEATVQGDRLQKSETALIKARMDLAEADEERSMLLRQISVLNRALSETAEQQNLSSAQALSGYHKKMKSRPFSISGPTQNWGAQQQQQQSSIRSAGVISPRASLQEPPMPVHHQSFYYSGVGAENGGSMSSRTSLDKLRRSSIPLSSLQRSKTQQTLPTAATPAASPPQPPPRGSVTGSRQDALARLNGDC